MGKKRAPLSIGLYKENGDTVHRRADQEIRADVTDFLTVDGELDASGIETTVADGAVTLHGTVASRYHKRLAELIAGGVRGVTGVTNELRAKEH